MALLLEVKNLSVSFVTPWGEVQALQDVNFSLKSGETLAVVGESGCGKTVLCKSILKLLPPYAQIKTGSVFVNGTDITEYQERKMCRLRGKVFSMVLQNPMTALNPTMTIGAQIAEAVKVHQPKIKGAQLRQQVVDLMQMAGIDRPMERMKQYPYQFSGGMCQRSVLAVALAGNPDILFADEPTTALDAVTQAQILKLFADIQQKRGMAAVFVTHDLRAAAAVADRVAVMKQGSILEIGTVKEILCKPRHPYTCGLLQAYASFSGEKNGAKPEQKKVEKEILLDIRHLSCRFLFKNNLENRIRKKAVVKAVDDLSFQIYQGEIFGLVGESGCGKSTTANCIMNIFKPDNGSIFFKGMDTCDPKEYRKNRQLLQKTRQLIFQNSASSLDPRMKVCDIIAEPMKIQHIIPKRGSMWAEAEYQMRVVGLGAEYLDRYPSELSGGQRQRVAIARALTTEPELIVADEPLASLDVRIQAQLADLFRELKKEQKVTILLIAHDLSLVESLCDRIGVMCHGRLVECAPTKELFANPKHPYTKLLLDADRAFGSL